MLSRNPMNCEWARATVEKSPAPLEPVSGRQCQSPPNSRIRGSQSQLLIPVINANFQMAPYKYPLESNINLYNFTLWVYLDLKVIKKNYQTFEQHWLMLLINNLVNQLMVFFIRQETNRWYGKLMNFLILLKLEKKRITNIFIHFFSGILLQFTK